MSIFSINKRGLIVKVGAITAIGRRMGESHVFFSLDKEKSAIVNVVVMIDRVIRAFIL